jgi:putative FmdB family regulatory protein
MPTYEYKCLECDKVFEEFQKMTDPLITSCKFCGGEVKRLISGGSGLLFKGSGFYITDHRSDSYKKEASRDKPEKPKSDKEKKPAETKANTASKTTSSEK